MSPEAQAELHGARPGAARNAGSRRSSRRGRRPMSTCSSTNMNGAVAAAGGDMAKAALDAGLIDRIGDRARVRGAARRSSAAATGRARRAVQADQARAPTSPTSSTRSPSGPIGVVTIAGMIVDGKAGPGHRRRRHDRQGDRGRRPQQGHQGAGRPRRQPGRVGARVRAHPPGAARGQGARRSRSSCRWAASPHRAAIGSRRRPTSSTPSRRRSPARSACSACFRASRARCRSSASAPTG